MPGFIRPQLATLKVKAPSGALWIHEIKYDGYRVQLRIDGDDRRAYTRNGYDWVSRFSRIAGAFDVEGQAIVDGEVVVIHEGRTNFSELQADLGRGDQDRLLYFAFDLLWLDGRDLRKEPQIERKRLLNELMEERALKEQPPAGDCFVGRSGQGWWIRAALRFGYHRSGLAGSNGICVQACRAWIC
ncbi:ATP-dependent DNA ligase [Bradyrhizobium sp. LB14.3]|uniref:ATP-dependent DNA ligase n=1 Tax=Bradyrhizobium sp. LB14.3 TaxID=3156328 RepID=UPI00339A14DE